MFTESASLRWFSHRVAISICLSVCAIRCSFFLGLRSHDQFQASHWSIYIYTYLTLNLNLLGNIYRIAQLSEQYRESTLPILISRKGNAGVVIENVGIVTQVVIIMKYSLSPREIPRASHLGFPSCTGYISSHIPPLVAIQIQYCSFRKDNNGILNENVCILTRDIQWIIAWALRKSLRLRPRDFFWD